jgi:phosphoribosylaminoimidazole (AIR) synthetase
MMQTFNCGVGFCIIVKKKDKNRIKKFFSKQFIPYEIGFISNNKNKINLINTLKW